MLKLITAPILEPITYAQLLHHLRVDTFDEAIDESSVEYADRLIAAIRRDCEAFTNRAFITQTWKQYLQSWPSENYIKIFKPPLQSATIMVLTKDEVSEVIDPTNYLVDTVSHKGRIVLAEGESWPTVDLYPMNPIQITFVCGYGDTPENVPAGIQQAILLQAGDLWDNREDYREGNLSRVSEKLLWQYRVFF
jgi:uncharacterized phiE125 gp8 family phage protein